MEKAAIAQVPQTAHLCALAVGGNVYHWEEKNMEGWLCPALFAFFLEAPKELYVQVKAG